VRIRSSNPGLQGSAGSGILLTPLLVLTAHHVLSGVDPRFNRGNGTGDKPTVSTDPPTILSSISPTRRALKSGLGSG
jgi:hypothetical protein